MRVRQSWARNADTLATNRPAAVSADLDRRRQDELAHCCSQPEAESYAWFAITVNFLNGCVIVQIDRVPAPK